MEHPIYFHDLNPEAAREFLAFLGVNSPVEAGYNRTTPIVVIRHPNAPAYDDYDNQPTIIHETVIIDNDPQFIGYDVWGNPIYA